MTEVLVTGATGFLGRVLLPRLPGALPLARGAPLPARAEAVVHLAPAGPDFLRSLVRLPGVRVFLLASSGNAREARGDAYGLGRREEEGIVLGAGLPRAVVLRLHTLFGPGGQKPERVVPRLLAAARAGLPVEVAAPDGVRLSLTHVEDAAEAVLRCLATTAARGILDVAGPEALTVGEIARRMGASLAVRAFRSGERDLVGDPAALRAALGWAPGRRFEPPYA